MLWALSNKPSSRREEGPMEAIRPTAHPVPEILAYRNDRVVARHAVDRGVTSGIAERRFHGLKQFLTVCAQRPGRKVASPAIDEIWHTFLMFTKDYRDFC